MHRLTQRRAAFFYSDNHLFQVVQIAVQHTASSRTRVNLGLTQRISTESTGCISYLKYGWPTLPRTREMSCSIFVADQIKELR